MLTWARRSAVRAGIAGAGLAVALATVTTGCGDQVTSTSAVPTGVSRTSGSHVTGPSPSPTLPPEPTPPAPSTSPSGLTLQVGLVEAALGHRASVVTMTNDGDAAITVEGYPEVDVLDAAGQSLGVTVEHDSSYMAIDPGPAPIRLAPGDQVLSVVSWSATVTDADPNAVENGSSVVVTPIPGEVPQTFPLDADLGTTGSISLTAWATELAQ